MFLNGTGGSVATADTGYRTEHTVTASKELSNGNDGFSNNVDGVEVDKKYLNECDKACKRI